MLAPTLIASQTLFKGKLTCLSECVIKGAVEGEIDSQEAVIIQSGGSFKGLIHAPILVVEGNCEGIIHCDKVKILPHGIIRGEIKSHLLIMHPKALFEGKRILVEKTFKDDLSTIEFDTENILL